METTMIEDSYYRTLYSVPVTLRQVEAAGVPLDSDIGSDGDEHTELLDNTDILRIVFGPVLDGIDISEAVRLQCYSMRLNSEPRWNDCVARISHASGAVMRTSQEHNQFLVEKLLEGVLPDWHDYITEARRPFDEYVEEYKRDNPDEFVGAEE